MRFLTVFVLCCTLLVFNGYAQFKADIINFIPVAPNTAALGKFGNVPVSYYTGLPSIEVPLYTIEQNSLRLPIKLSYHAGGIKVSEIASWAGLGFALSAGGSIIRNERGMQDDHTMGYLRNGKTLELTSLSVTDYYNAGKGYLDLESDEYILNVNGISAKFVLDKQAHAVIVPFQPLQIYPLDQNGNVFTVGGLGSIFGWRVVAPDGIQYTFSAMERTEQVDIMQNNSHLSAWQLSSIVSADGQDNLKFEYEEAPYLAFMPVSQTETYLVLPNNSGCSEVPPPSNRYSMRTVFDAKRIKKITFAQGTVEFVPSTGFRCDAWGDEYLDSVIVKNVNHEIVKAFRLRYGYMVGKEIKSLDQVTCDGFGSGNDVLRLVLLSVDEVGKGSYTFDYIRSIGLPSRFSKAQDHWGFFNRNTSTSLIPKRAAREGQASLLGDERDPDSVYMQEGTLNRITYPTGGSTQFEYEAHRINDESLGYFPEFLNSFEQIHNGTRTIRMNFGNVVPPIASFKVVTPGMEVYIETDSVPPGTGHKFEIRNEAGNVIAYSWVKLVGATNYYYCSNLAPGTYSLYSWNRDHEQGPTLQTYPLRIIAYDELIVKPKFMRIIGGLRIKQIVDLDPLTGGTISKEFTYSPGTLNWGVKYTSRQQAYGCYQLSPDGQSLGRYTIMDYEVLSSSSNYPLSNTQGAPVGYVTVKMTEYALLPENVRRENGYTHFEYTDSKAYPDGIFPSKMIEGHARHVGSTPVNITTINDGNSLFVTQFPYGPSKSRDFKRGLLLRTTVRRRNDDGTYTSVHVATNNYEFGVVGVPITGVRCGTFFDSSVPIDAVTTIYPLNAPVDKIGASFYTVESEYYYLTDTNVETWEEGRKMTISSNYYYNTDPGFPVRTVTTTSNREKTIQVNNTPLEYAPGTPFIDALVQRNNIRVPVEQVVCREMVDGPRTIVGGLLNVYKNNGFGQLDSVMLLEVPASLALANFKFSNRVQGVLPEGTTGQTAFAPDSRYVKRVSFPKYDRGALVEQKKTDDVLMSYIWDYGNKLTVARITNASSDRSAYTSFESDGASWAMAGGTVTTAYKFTGSKSLQLGGNTTMTKSALPVDNYLVSYWSRSGSMLVNGSAGVKGTMRNGWTYYEHMLSSVSNVTLKGTGIIDELRLHPASARMATYTHRPLIGVSAMTDENSVPTYYEYDANGRLQVVRDADNKILQHYQYHYKGQ